MSRICGVRCYQPLNLNPRTMPSNGLRVTALKRFQPRIAELNDAFSKHNISIRHDRTRSPAFCINIYFRDLNSLRSYANQATHLNIRIMFLIPAIRVENVRHFPMNYNGSSMVLPHILKIFKSDLTPVDPTIRFRMAEKSSHTSSQGSFVYIYGKENEINSFFKGGHTIDTSKNIFGIGHNSSNYTNIYDRFSPIKSKRPCILVSREYMGLQCEGRLTYPNMFLIRFRGSDANHGLLKILKKLNIHAHTNPESGYSMIRLADYDSFLSLHKLVHSRMYPDLEVKPYNPYNIRWSWNIDPCSIIIFNFPDIPYDEIRSYLDIGRNCHTHYAKYFDQKAIYVNGPEDEITKAWFNHGKLIENKSIRVAHAFTTSAFARNTLIISDVAPQLMDETADAITNQFEKFDVSSAESPNGVTERHLYFKFQRNFFSISRIINGQIVNITHMRDE
ncbi:hypothetical protein RF11_01442 [Thelohanellus kitauei]|uniref:Uncharacterized protein n=1 Tax=Thelohanellus kitauei TaxID=669202 RepID=A0A0C2MGK8_THEKT|nr:hypothetical protein RF11_01442 [Thelohanellus kitauei]